MYWLTIVVLSLLMTGVFALALAGPEVTVPTPDMLATADDGLDPALTGEVERQSLDFLNFLKTHWGMDQETVRSAATGTLRRDGVDKLVYSRRLAEHAVLEGYQFQGSKLVRGQYAILQRHIRSTNEFINYYAHLKATLTAIHGAPQNDQTIWVNDLYRALPEYWGVAVMMGHLEYTVTWATPEGTISVELTSDRHSRLMIEYRSKDFVINDQIASLP